MNGSPENPQTPEAIRELLNKLRIAQEDILHDTSGDVFAEGIRLLRREPGFTEQKVERFQRAFEFARRAGRMPEEELFAGLREHGPALSELKDVYPETHDECSRIDYLMFVASLLGGIPEDRFNETQLRGGLPDRENAQKHLKMTERLLKAAAGIPDADLRALVARGLLGGVSFLELEASGAEDERQTFGRDDDAAELFELAARFSVPPAVVSRAMELSERQLAQTMERRRRRKAMRRRA